jgi:hypothetical protein
MIQPTDYKKFELMSPLMSPLMSLFIINHFE